MDTTRKIVLKHMMDSKNGIARYMIRYYEKTKIRCSRRPKLSALIKKMAFILLSIVLAFGGFDSFF